MSNHPTRRYITYRLCIHFDEPRVYPVYDTYEQCEINRFDDEQTAQKHCDVLNTEEMINTVFSVPKSDFRQWKFDD